jgi:hypothetical protein
MYRRTIRTMAALLAIGVLSSIVPNSAQATTFLPLSTENMADVATLIVEGEVQEVWTELDERSGNVWTLARVRVTEALKGGVNVESEITVHSLGGSIGQYSTHVEGQAVFSEGEHVLMFLHHDVNDHYVPIGKFLGKLTVRRAAGDSREHVMRWHPRPEWAFDARFLPHPAPEKRVYAEDFKKQITDHLAQPWSGEEIPGVSKELLERVNTVENRRAQ